MIVSLRLVTGMMHLRSILDAVPRDHAWRVEVVNDSRPTNATFLYRIYTFAIRVLFPPRVAPRE